MNFTLNWKIACTLLRALPVWKFILSGGVLYSAATVYRFWDHPIPWSTLVFTWGCSALIIICAFWLQLRIALSKTFVPVGEKFSFTVFPRTENIALNEKDTLPTLNVLLMIASSFLVVVFLSLMHLADNRLAFNAYFGIMLLLVGLYAYSGSLPAICWIEETLDGFLSIIAPVLLLLSFERYPPLELTLQSYVIPLFFLFLSFQFILSMIQVERSSTWTPGFFPAAIRKNFSWLHYLFIFFALITVILFNLRGVHWWLQWRQLLSFPTLALQIIWVERVFNGRKPDWKVIGWLGFGNILLWNYFQLITIWFG